MGKPSRGSWSFVRGVLGIVLLLTLALTPVSARLDPAVLSSDALAPHSKASPFMFIENAGQWLEDARYQVWGSPLGVGTTWLAEDAIWISIVERGEVGTLERSNVSTFQRSNAEPVDGQGVNLKITFPGASPDVRIQPFDPLTTTVSYFIGNDPEQWRPDVPVYGGVRYLDLYPGVDLEMTGVGGQWTWQMVIHDAGVPLVTHPSSPAHLHIEGAAGVTLTGDHLHLATAAGGLELMLPLSALTLQVEVATSEPASAIFDLRPGAVQTSPLAPEDESTDLLYSTFLGGTGSDGGLAIDVDAGGSVYVTGLTESSDFPTTPGAFDTSYNGGNCGPVPCSDAFVAKLNPDGSGLAYATFLGGSDDDDGLGIAVDGAGSAYVTGGTGSSDFPTTEGAFEPSLDGWSDAFVAKLNPDGSGLDYATFLGGSRWEQGYAIAVDGAGSAYVTGGTGSTDFPTTPDAFNPSHNGGNCDGGYPCDDAFVTKLNPDGSGLVYGTFLGGSYYDYGYAIGVDAAGSAYVTGSAGSADFPTTAGSFDTTFDGGIYDAFVAKFNPDGSGLDYATFLGSTGRDDGLGIAVDGAGSAYVTGRTESSDFPTTPGAFDPSHNGGGCYGDSCRDTFVVKLNPGGSDLTYATFLGGSDNDWGRDIALDEASSAYVVGGTMSSDFPTTPGAFDASFNSGGCYGDSCHDVFGVKLSPDGSSLAYATFLGDTDHDWGEGIAVDGAGNAYVTGVTYSHDFPTTPGAFDPSFNGSYPYPSPDAFVAKLNLLPYVPNVVAQVEHPSTGTFVSGIVILSGFAIDLGSPVGTGIDAVHIYLDGPYSTGTFIGSANYGLDRPDIAAQYGARFGPSGWELSWDTSGVAPGVHQLYLYARRTTDNTWSLMPPHPIIVAGGNQVWLPVMLRSP